MIVYLKNTRQSPDDIPPSGVWDPFQLNELVALQKSRCHLALCEFIKYQLKHLQKILSLFNIDDVVAVTPTPTHKEKKWLLHGDIQFLASFKESLKLLITYIYIYTFYL